MIDFNSKYTGEEVEALLDAANGKQDAIKDLDAIRAGATAGATALQSVPSEYVTESELTNKGYATTSALNDKVDKVSGKQLSTEDFTTALKTKLEGLSNYDDTELSEALSTLRGDFDKLVSGDTTTAIKTFNEVIAFLDGLTDTQDLSSIIASIEQQIAGKMDKVTLATVATSGSYNDLSNKPTIPAEQVNADWNATSGKAQILNKPTIPTAVTESTVSEWGFAKSSALQTKAEDSSVVHKTGNETISGAKTFNNGVNFLGNGDTNAVTLSTNTRINVNGTNQTVLGFGSGTFYINHANYSLLLRGKDTRPKYNSTTLALSSDIPAAVTENTVSGWGFTKNTGTYSKPSTGIPKTDLASAVQTSLGKADTALQSYTEQYKGTITGVSANGTSVATSGVANIPAASTSAYGVTKLSSATNSTSTSLAATASAVKAAYDLANSKQNTLISGTNIKTINGTSILGSGNIEIGGGSSSSGGAYPEVDGSRYEEVNGIYACYDATPNTFYVFPECASLAFFPIGDVPQDGLAHEYLFQFTSGATATTLSLPSDLKWANDSPPTIEPNMIYQVSILKGLASCLEFSNKGLFPATIVVEQGGYAELYSYFMNNYSLPDSSKPSGAIECTEQITVEDTNGMVDGNVIKVSLSLTDRVFFFTEKSIDNYYAVYINKQGVCGTYMYD